MTDSELTAAAARAAGIEIEPGSDHPDGSHWMKSGTCLPDGQCVWHPLRNDTHAFRLAVMLDIDITWAGEQVFCLGTNKATLHIAASYQPIGSDKFAAARRAIVGTAAMMAPVI